MTKDDLVKRVLASVAEEKRQADERHLMRCTIIGSALVEAMRSDKGLADQLAPIIDKRVVNERERRALGLLPLRNESSDHDGQ